MKQELMKEVLEYLAKAITLEIKIFKIKMAEQGKTYSDEEIMDNVMNRTFISRVQYGEESLQDFRDKVALFEKLKKYKDSLEAV